MKKLLVCFLLTVALAAVGLAQVSIVTSGGGNVVTATSGDIHCVFTRIPTIDPFHIECWKGFTVVLNTNVNVLTGHTVSSSISTPDGNFISWKLTHPGPGDFEWDVNADGDEHVGTF